MNSWGGRCAELRQSDALADRRAVRLLQQLAEPVLRIVVLDGKPDAVSLEEKFLSERAAATAALAERLRTRIVRLRVDYGLSRVRYGFAIDMLKSWN